MCVCIEHVDVNVTPDKRQVLLYQEKMLLTLIKVHTYMYMYMYVRMYRTKDTKISGGHWPFSVHFYKIADQNIKRGG